MTIDNNRTDLNVPQSHCRAELAETTIVPEIQPSLPSKMQQASKALEASTYQTERLTAVLDKYNKLKTKSDEQSAVIAQCLQSLGKTEIDFDTFQTQAGARSSIVVIGNRYHIEQIKNETGS